MASAKKTNEAEVTDNKKPVRPEAAELANFLPAELAAEGTDGLVSIGGLTPIYNYAAAYDNDWAPLCGFLVGVEEIEVDAENENESQRIRKFLRIQATTATKATTGNRQTGHKEQDIRIGEDVLLPISGALKNITQIEAACLDPKKYYFGYFKVIGTEKLNGKNQLTPMWVIDSRMHTTGLPRRGRFLKQEVPELMGKTVGGELYNQQTGEMPHQASS